MLDSSSAAVAQASTEIVIGSAPQFWNANPSHKPPGCSDVYEAAVGDLLVFKYSHEVNVWRLADKAAWEACSWAGATKLAGEAEGGASSADSATGIVNQWSAVTTAPGVLHFAAAYYSSGDQREFCQDGQKIRVRVSDGQAPVCPSSLPIYLPPLPPLPLSPVSPPPGLTPAVQFELPSPLPSLPSPPYPPSPPTPPHPPAPETTDSGDAALSDAMLPVAIAVGSVSAVMAAIVSVVVLRRRRRANLRSATPSGQPASERVVRESHPVIAPDGDVSLATKTAA